MNQTTIAGHLGADPEVRFTSSGQKVTTLRVAAKGRKAKDKDPTIWWKATIWGEQFDKMVSFLKKGSPIVVVGEMNVPEIFTDREGRPQVSMSVTVGQLYFSPFGKPESQNSSHEQNHHHEEKETASFGQAKESAFAQEEEIPF